MPLTGPRSVKSILLYVYAALTSVKSSLLPNSDVAVVLPSPICDKVDNGATHAPGAPTRLPLMTLPVPPPQPVRLAGSLSRPCRSPTACRSCCRG